tara:strand:+ start:524 stop:751 length:228 start_codon:yes stop_codon:yes gene_type:complete
MKQNQKWSYIDNDGNIKRKEPCCLCSSPIEPQRDAEGKIFWEHGHNAQPVMDGSCCDKCNQEKVIPARLQGIMST